LDHAVKVSDNLCGRLS